MCTNQGLAHQLSVYQSRPCPPSEGAEHPALAGDATGQRRGRRECAREIDAGAGARGVRASAHFVPRESHASEQRSEGLRPSLSGGVPARGGAWLYGYP